MSHQNVESISARHLESAVELIRASMPEDLLDFMIYGQAGIVRFLREGMRRDGSSSRSQTWVVPGVGNEVIAYAEFTFPRAKVAHLAYLAVSPQARGRGLATLLLREFIARNKGQMSLELNVFANNIPAMRLYERLGFTSDSLTLWLVRDLPEPRGSANVTDLDASLEAHSKFGFSQFHVNVDNGNATFGRLGTDIVRAYSARDFEDDSTLAGIRSVYPSTTKAFVVLDEAVARKVRAPHTVMAESVAMRLPLSMPT